MKTTVNVYDFRDAFARMGRKNFSYDGLGLLFEYLEDFENSTGEEIELDVVAICCDFAEDYPRAIAEQYGIDNRGMNDEETADAVREYLNDEGCLVNETQAGSMIYRQH